MKRSMLVSLSAGLLALCIACGVLLWQNAALRRSLTAARETAAQLQERLQELEGSPYSQ